MAVQKSQVRGLGRTFESTRSGASPVRTRTGLAPLPCRGGMSKRRPSLGPWLDQFHPWVHDPPNPTNQSPRERHRRQITEHSLFSNTHCKRGFTEVANISPTSGEEVEMPHKSAVNGQLSRLPFGGVLMR